MNSLGKNVLSSKRGVRFSKALKNTLPANVYAEVVRMAGEYCKTITFTTVTEDYSFYMGEGDRISVIAGEKSAASIEMVSEASLGASGVSHKIGESFKLTTGHFVIVVHYYNGFSLTLYNVQPREIA